MPIDDAKPWEQQLRETTARAEEELRRVMTYINDEVVPDIRRNGSVALRAAAVELHKLAERMEDHRSDTSAPAPQPPRSAANRKDQPKP